MTDEQIKQNAESIVQELSVSNEVVMYSHSNMITAAILGAHSRDKEVDKLKKLYEEVLHKYYEAECKLCNPWISIKDRLPERMTSIDSNGVKIIDCCSKDVFGYDASYKMGRLVCYNYESEMWESHDAYTIGKITHWMPVPKIQTQNKED